MVDYFFVRWFIYICINMNFDSIKQSRISIFRKQQSFSYDFKIFHLSSKFFYKNFIYTLNQKNLKNWTENYKVPQKNRAIFGKIC